MADWFIATEGVKVVKDSASLWPQIITAVSTISAALGGVCLTHSFTRKREEKAATTKREAELYFISTELVFILERFAQRCVLSACERGEYDEEGWIKIEDFLPEIDYASVAGDWRALPPQLMYRLSELPVIRQEAASSVNSAFNEETPYDGSEGLYELNCQSARLGLKAIRLSRSLRIRCGMPENELSKNSSSTWRLLWQVRANCMQKKLIHARNTRAFNELVGTAIQDSTYE